MNNTTASHNISSGWPVFLDPGLDVEAFLKAKDEEFADTLAPLEAYIVLLFLVGAAGNSLTLVVYYKKFKPSLTRVYILTMAACDLATNVWSMPVELLEIHFHNTYYSIAGCKLSWFVLSVFALFSGFLLVAVAYDRQRAVCRRQLGAPDSVKRATYTIPVCFLSALLLSIPRAILTTPQSVSFPGSNITGMTCSFQQAQEQPAFYLTYTIFLNGSFGICLLLLIICYGRIGVHLYRHKRVMSGRATAGAAVGTTQDSTSISTTMDNLGAPEQGTAVRPRVRGSSGRQMHKRTTFMLFVLTVFFVANYLPYLAINFLREEGTPTLVVSGLNVNVSHILHRSYHLNSVINSFIYYFCSAKFRYEVQRLLCEKRC